ncbi:sigma 54-interacting transcriptional regulator [Myxococcota bacterium]|nr:sigma 54-interacting transcriptional regulator [Myxococcota bacterium]
MAIDPKVTLSRSTFTTGFTDRGDELALSVVSHPSSGLLGRSTLLGQGLRVGRDAELLGPGCLDDNRLSRHHFEIGVGEVGAWLEDLQSRNGTTLNGEPVQGRRALTPGDVIGAGRMLFLLHPTRAAFRRPQSERLLGVGSAIAAVLEQIDQVATHPTTVLIQGETGTGKELVAQELHARSGRRGRFVAVNCGGVSEGVLQSELFGHKRGAFSGATESRGGLVEAAAGGTLFLDEIGDAPPALQVALLRLLQDREYRAVGSDVTLRTDARFVAATHRPLFAAVQAGAFRQDLHARLARWTLEVPALRARREDIPHLVAAFVRRRLGREVPVSRRLMTALLRADWPGNVRQLDAVVERLSIAQAGAECLELDATLEALLSAEVASPAASATPTSAPVALPARPSTDAPSPASPPAGGPHKRPSPDELRTLARAHEGNLTKLAGALGIGRTTLYRWLLEMGLDPESLR